MINLNCVGNERWLFLKFLENSAGSLLAVAYRNDTNL
mgnify:CR=1 FL=1